MMFADVMEPKRSLLAKKSELQNAKNKEVELMKLKLYNNPLHLAKNHLILQNQKQELINSIDIGVIIF